MKFLEILVKLLYCSIILVLIVSAFILEMLNGGDGPILKVCQWLKGLNWYLVFPLIISSITTILICLQWRINERLTRFTCMPRVAFTIRSGENDFFRKKRQHPSKLGIKLNTHFLVKNNSDFPVYFWVKVAKIEIKYRDKNLGQEKIDNNINYRWFIFPHARLNGQDEGEILYKNILNKSKLNNTDRTKEILNKRVDELNNNDEKILEEEIINKIESVGVEIKISSSPAYQENFHFDMPLEMWPFVFKDEATTEKFVWRTPRSGVSDRNVTFYEEYREVYNQ